MRGSLERRRPRAHELRGNLERRRPRTHELRGRLARRRPRAHELRGSLERRRSGGAEVLHAAHSRAHIPARTTRPQLLFMQPPPRGGCGAISLHLRCRCDAPAGTPARIRALPAVQRGAIPLGATRRPPREHLLPGRCRRHATRHPARARALASRARNRIGAARRPQRDTLRSEIGPPMRRASIRLRGRASAIQASQEAAWRRAPTPAQTDSRAAIHPWGCDADATRRVIPRALERWPVARGIGLAPRADPSAMHCVPRLGQPCDARVSPCARER